MLKTEEQIKSFRLVDNSATRTALRTLKSTTGYYLLNDDMSSPYGYKYTSKGLNS